MNKSDTLSKQVLHLTNSDDRTFDFAKCQFFQFCAESPSTSLAISAKATSLSLSLSLSLFHSLYFMVKLFAVFIVDKEIFSCRRRRLYRPKQKAVVFMLNHKKLYNSCKAKFHSCDCWADPDVHLILLKSSMQQCDQIWRNFASLELNKISLAILWGFI